MTITSESYFENFIFRKPKSTTDRSADLPPSYSVVMDNSDVFQTISTHVKSETPPPSFESQVQSSPSSKIDNGSNHRNQMHQTVQTITGSIK